MASENPRPSSSSSSAADSYIGSTISLISKYEIRYEGVLYFLNVKDSTIGLKNVKSFGTEGRKTDGPQIPPSDKEYEYILFRGSDIKDLHVQSSPPDKAEEQLHNDPAIIQTHFTGVPFASPSATLGGKGHYQDTPAVISRGRPEETQPYQSGMHFSTLHQTQSADVHASPNFSTPISSQSYNVPIISPVDGTHYSIPSLSQPNALVPGTTQDQVFEPRSSATRVFTSTYDGNTHVPSSVAQFPVHPTVASFPVHPTEEPFPVHSSSQASIHFFNSAAVSSSTMNLSLSPGTHLIPSHNPAMPSTISSTAVSDHAMAYPAASLERPYSGPLLMPQLSVLAANQFVQPGYGVPSHMQQLYSNTDKGTAMPAQLNIFSPISGQTPKEPLLPLPASAPQQNLSAPYTEEFDFEAMNEKFKKDEVWGALGKFDKKDTAETEDPALRQSFGNRESESLAVSPNTTTAYKKDDFFDTISCNSLSQGARPGQNRFSERMKMDSETFGNFRFRPPFQNYGAYGAGRGRAYRGQNSWGRGGYGYGGRGGGRHTPQWD